MNITCKLWLYFVDFSGALYYEAQIRNFRYLKLLWYNTVLSIYRQTAVRNASARLCFAVFYHSSTTYLSVITRRQISAPTRARNALCLTNPLKQSLQQQQATHEGSWLMLRHLWNSNSTSLKKVSRCASICWQRSNTAPMSSMYRGLKEVISARAAWYFSRFLPTSSRHLETRSAIFFTWNRGYGWVRNVMMRLRWRFWQAQRYK